MPVDAKHKDKSERATDSGEEVSQGSTGTLNDTERVLVVEKEEGLTWFKLNRPKVMNCLNRPLLKAIVEACEEAAADRSTRVIAIIGSGSKTFCAGADLTERKGMTPAETLDYLSLIQKTMRTIETMPQPVIAAINGSAYGGGTELALACDLRVMVEEAVLRLTEVKLGIIPGAGGTQRLPRLIGKSKAKEMILTGSPITAQHGYNLGLVHRLVPKSTTDGEEFNTALVQEVRAWATEIAGKERLFKRFYAILRIDSEERLDALRVRQHHHVIVMSSRDHLTHK
ncbi:MAG TPA: enoyl-CoA hydratase/isomerase family protein, partial [Candidatus Obscuribacterales bacterium]